MSIKVDQTIMHSHPTRQGNCLAACVASVLGLPLEAVPHFAEYPAGEFCEGDAWWHLLIGFMAGHGLWPYELEDLADAKPGELVMVAGPSPRGPFWHQVIYRDGALWHDPHPSRDGLLEPREAIAWRPVVHDHSTRIETRWDVCPWHPASPEARDRRRMGVPA